MLLQKIPYGNQFKRFHSQRTRKRLNQEVRKSLYLKKLKKPLNQKAKKVP